MNVSAGTEWDDDSVFQRLKRLTRYFRLHTDRNKSSFGLNKRQSIYYTPQHNGSDRCNNYRKPSYLPRFHPYI